MFEEKNINRRNKVFSILGVFILLITIVGVAVAAYTWTYVGTKANTIGTGSVSLSLLESTDVINITNALPTADASGMALGSDQSFDFAVTTYASGNPGDITYSLNISKVTIDSGYTVLPDNGVKVYLTALTDGGEVQVVKPTLVSNIITSGSTGLLTFDSGKTNYLTHNHDTGDTTKTTKYRLRMWIDQTVDATNWNENTKNQYKLKIGVTS